MRQKRDAHVDAVQPDLMRVDFFVPEGAIAGFRVIFELVAQYCGSFFVFGFTGLLVSTQQHIAAVNAVDVKFFALIAVNTAIGSDKRVGHIQHGCFISRVW